ncbi:hypothetical protein BurMR1_3552 [Burkholderia sp. MR1]|nr:hypothetical protein BurMR1_3552 [Burkholderia sp. MR1]
MRLGCHPGRPPFPPLSQPSRPEASALAAKVRSYVDDRSLPALARRNASAASIALYERKDWRHALYDLRQRMKCDETRALRLKKGREWEESHPGQRYQPDLDAAYGSWERFCDAGQLLLTTTHRRLVARLSIGSYKRGLFILQMVCREAERRGYIVEMTDRCERLTLSKDSASVELRISEKLTRSKRHRFNCWDKSRVLVRTLTPTGQLVLFVGQQASGHTGLADCQGLMLENRLDDILAAVDYRHQGFVRRADERTERERRSKEIEIRCQQEERQCMEQRRKAEEEEKRRQALISEVENWRQAQPIRTYLASLEKLDGSGQPREDYRAWREWALTVADDLDPIYLHV